MAVPQIAAPGNKGCKIYVQRVTSDLYERLVSFASAAPAPRNRLLNGESYIFRSYGDGYWACNGRSESAKFNEDGKDPRKLQIKCNDTYDRVDFYLDEGEYKVGVKLNNPNGKLYEAGGGTQLGTCTVLNDQIISCTGLTY